MIDILVFSFESSRGSGRVGPSCHEPFIPVNFQKFSCGLLPYRMPSALGHPVGQRSAVLAVCAGGGCLDIYLLPLLSV